MAYEIINRLEDSQNIELLKRLKALVSDREKSKDNCTDTKPFVGLGKTNLEDYAIYFFQRAD